MGKNILSGLFFVIALNLNAQNIEVGFKPKDNAVVIDSIRAINQNTNQTVKLTGSETLTLVKSSTTGFGNLPINSGQLVSSKEQTIEAGQHRFSLQLHGQGIYYIAVQKGDESINYKVVSIGKGLQSASISYAGNEQRYSASTQSNILKSAVAGKTISYADGNNIMYTVYFGKNATVITDKAGTSKTIEVAFYPCDDKDG